MHRWRPLAFVPVAAVAGCTCGARQPPAPNDKPEVVAGPPASSRGGGAVAGPKLDLAVFSAPIAASRAAHQSIVAGLVAGEGVVRAMGMVDVHPVWAADVLTGVVWAPDAELRAQAAGDGGVALVWRGPRSGKIGRTLVAVGPRGEIRGEPTEIGAALCATGDGLAWIDARTRGPTRVLARGWSEPAGRNVVSVASDRDATLVCGDHVVFVLGDGDDDLTATVFVPGGGAPKAPAVALRDADFGDDDEREHDAYTVGDDLGLVRVGSSGAVALREVPHDGAPDSWRRLKESLPPDDDVVAVDGNADATFIVFTHDADAACPGIGSTAESVRALRVDRKTGAESLLDLAAADCDRAAGPFWIAADAPGGLTIGWVERATRLAAKAPPIAGVSLRTIPSGGGVMKPRRIELQADAVVDAGCDDQGCSLAALLRPAGADGMQPEPIAVIGYP
jgi:hypothetical protein